MNTTPNTPPPAGHDASASGPGTPAGPAAPSGGSGAGRAITIVAAIVGGIALLGAGGGAAFAATGQFRPAGSAHGLTAPIDGITDLEVDAGGADVTVRFGDVTDAELRVDGRSPGEWEMRRDEDTLRVNGPNGRWGWWGWWGSWSTDDVVVVLTVPEQLEGRLDADLQLSAGSLTASGDFRELDLELGAGAMTVDGSATSVSAQISAGRADLTLDGVREADLTMSAGRLEAELTGSQPDEVSLDATAGSMTVILPQGAYAVDQEVAAGSFDNGLQTSASARSVVTVQVAAGSISVREGR